MSTVYRFSIAKYESWLKENDLGDADWDAWAKNCQGKEVKNMNTSTGVGFLDIGDKRYVIDINWCEEVSVDD